MWFTRLVLVYSKVGRYIRYCIRFYFRVRSENGWGNWIAGIVDSWTVVQVECR